MQLGRGRIGPIQEMLLEESNEILFHALLDGLEVCRG